ncbi:hypothetical protein [Lichenifustis flavocetrariae]|uniref:Uncharacterized protein n=1 Tax=Lichenifustis flavocetrariae TaxID=2949735 RepID=A0AA41Z1D4_9HYPH|nr:hypothetical protein [Lichenifustis flavocetrariae]MCW6511919.1 hypothetical protein [Lichenifustis flavocetrariae]
MGFQWFRRRKAINSILTTISILVSSANEIEYYNKYYEAAHFEPGAVQGEIKRIADLYQAHPRILKMERNAEGNSAVIALWGSLMLTPLDPKNVSLLASGQVVNSGILIDFLGDYRASARRGLPVYKISGGSGYYWAARFNDGGDGTLRFGIADASVFNAASAPAQATSDQALAFSEVMPTAIVPPRSPVGSAPDDSAQAEAKEKANQAEAEAQAARNAAAAKLRKAQFERASTNAKKAIDDASAFVKSSATTPKLLDYVQQIADLNDTLSASDANVTEAKTKALLRSLQDDPDFQRFRDERDKQRQRQIARDLGDAVHTLTSQRQFLVGYVTRDPTSANASKLLPLIKRAEVVVASPDLDRVQTLLGQVDIALQDAGLSDEFAASQKMQQPDDSTQGDSASSSEAHKIESAEAQQKTGVQLVGTEKNAFLLKGDLQDVVLMYNSSSSAPHVVRNLRGDIVFTEGRADACLFGRDGDDRELSAVMRSTLSAYNTAKTVVLGGDPCNADQLNTYDVVATRRGTFLRQDPEAALALIKAIEIDAFKSLVTVTDAQLKAAASADAVAATEIAADVEKGVKEGFGLILFTGNSAAICLVAQDQVEAHRQLLVGHAERLASDMRAAPTLVPTSPDGAFVNAKRGQCGAIYAQSAELKDLAGALKRDGLAYRFSSVWIETDKVKAMADKLRMQNENAARQSAERQRRQIEEQHLASLRAADEASKLANLQAASRDKYLSSANASQANIAADVKEFMDHPDNSEGVARVFPTFASLYRNELANRWELMSENAALEDYGMSDFKGRKLETALSRINIGLKNRMLGDYKSECFIFGEIEDSEFAMRRDPIAVSCDDDAALSSWKIQHGFKSVWTLSTADPTAIGRY